jgi:hypothetical protein
MRRPPFRSTGTWLEIRSAVQFTVWPKKSKAWLLNWSQVPNWSQAQRNLFVLILLDGRWESNPRPKPGSHQTCGDEKFWCNFGAVKEGKEPSIFP